MTVTVIGVLHVSVWRHQWTVETWRRYPRHRHRHWSVWWVWVDCHDAGTTSTALLIPRLWMSMTRPWWHHGQLHYRLILPSTASSLDVLMLRKCLEFRSGRMLMSVADWRQWQVLFVVRNTSSKRRLLTARSHESLLTSVKASSSTDVFADVGDLVQRSIDLEGCTGGSVEIHPLHGSVLGQQHCFQVSTRVGNTYFACRSDEERREWMEQYVISL